MKKEYENEVGSVRMYEIYKTSTGLYIKEDICKEYNIGNKEDYKEIKGNKCLNVDESEIRYIEKKSAYQDSKLIPIYISVFDMQLVLSFNVYIDRNHNNSLYISRSLCKKYAIKPISRRIFNGTIHCEVTEEDIEKIEELTKNEKVTLKRKYSDIELGRTKDEYLFVYYKEIETGKTYITRTILELTKSINISIEGTPKIIDNKNCYSITDEQIKEIESKTTYKGILKIVRQENGRIIPYDDSISNMVEEAIPYDDYISTVSEDIMPYNDFISTIIEEAIPYDDSISTIVEDVIPYDDFISTITEEAIPYNDSISTIVEDPIPYDDEASTIFEDVITYDDNISTIIEEPIPYNDSISTVTENVIPYDEFVSALTEDIIPYDDEISTITEEPIPYDDNASTIIEDAIPYDEAISTIIEEPIPYNESISTIIEDAIPYDETISTIIEEPIPYNESISTIIEDAIPYDDALSTILDSTNTEEVIPYDETLSNIVEDVMPFDDTISTITEDTTEELIPYDESLSNIVEDVMPFDDTISTITEDTTEELIPYDESLSNIVEDVMPFDDNVSTITENTTEELIPYDESLSNIVEDVMPFDDTISKVPELETVIAYRDRRTNKLYIPQQYALNIDRDTKTIMRRLCYETSMHDLERIYNRRIIIVDVFPYGKETYNVIVCNSKGKFYVPERTIKELNISIGLQHKIMVNKEIYVEINRSDLDAIKAKENKNLEINIELKHITPTKKRN